MKEVYIPLVSALAGAVIGSLSAIATVYIQGLLQNKRERTRLALEVAMQDQKHMAEHAKGGTIIYPLSVWVYFHWKLIDLIERNKLTPDSLRKLQESLKEVLEVVDENKEIEKPKQA